MFVSGKGWKQRSSHEAGGSRLAGRRVQSSTWLLQMQQALHLVLWRLCFCLVFVVAAFFVAVVGR